MKKKAQKKSKELKTLSAKEMEQVQGGCAGGADDSKGHSASGGRG